MVLKDNDLNLKLRLDQTSAEMLANQIADDVAFLQSQKIMDYSLLLGVHRAKYRLVERQSSRVALSRCECTHTRTQCLCIVLLLRCGDSCCITTCWGAQNHVWALQYAVCGAAAG